MKNEKVHKLRRKGGGHPSFQFQGKPQKRNLEQDPQKKSSKSAKKSELLEFQIQECSDIPDKYEFSGVYNADSMQNGQSTERQVSAILIRYILSTDKNEKKDCAKKINSIIGYKSAQELTIDMMD